MRRRLLAVVTAALLLGLALPVLANGQDTCPEGDGWVKVDGLDGQSYTYPVPEGFEVTSNCFKAGNDLVFGSGPTVENTTVVNQNGNLRDISHASFLLVEIERPDPVLPSVTSTCDTVTIVDDDEHGWFIQIDDIGVAGSGADEYLGNPGQSWAVWTEEGGDLIGSGTFEACTPDEETTTTTITPVTPTPDVIDDAPEVDEEEATTTTVAPAVDPTTTTQGSAELAELPFTGSEDVPLALTALALIGAGAVALARGFRAED